MLRFVFYSSGEKRLHENSATDTTVDTEDLEVSFKKKKKKFKKKDI